MSLRFVIEEASATTTDKQVNISNHFSKGAPPRDNRAAQFDGVSHHLDPDTGLPILHGALGVVHCRKRETLIMGDHMVWFGDVTSAPEVWVRKSAGRGGHVACMSSDMHGSQVHVVETMWVHSC